MKLILLSGGSGKRLWPLSNDVRSKQVIKILSGEDGNKQSMVQRVYEQISSVMPVTDIVVSAGASQADSLRSQLNGKIDIVLEPERRDTYPAIALSCAYLAFEKNVDREETVIVLPVDPYVGIEYFYTLNIMDEVVRAGEGQITLMGIKPRKPSSKYGYIVPEKEARGKYMKAKRFVEKPDEETARKLIEAGALWNGGVFGFKLGYFLDVLKRDIDFSSYGDVFCKYSQLEKTSVDYKVVEEEKNIAVVPYSGQWRDIGTWSSFSDVIEETSFGNVIMDKCTDTSVINELNIPMVVLGAKNMIAVASHDGILVSDKNDSGEIKKYVDDCVLRPMYKDKRWGSITVIDHGESGETNYLTRHVKINGNMHTSYHRHHNRSEVWTVVSGEAEIVVDGDSRILHSGDAITIKAGHYHAIKAIAETHLIEVQTGTSIDDRDADYLSIEW